VYGGERVSEGATVHGGCPSSREHTLVVVVVVAGVVSSTPNVRVKVRDSGSCWTSTPGGAETVIPGPGPPGAVAVAPGVTVTDDGPISALTGSVDGT